MKHQWANTGLLMGGAGIASLAWTRIQDLPFGSSKASSLSLLFTIPPEPRWSTFNRDRGENSCMGPRRKNQQSEKRSTAFSTSEIGTPAESHKESRHDTSSNSVKKTYSSSPYFYREEECKPFNGLFQETTETGFLNLIISISMLPCGTFVPV